MEEGNPTVPCRPTAPTFGHSISLMLNRDAEKWGGVLIRIQKGSRGARTLGPLSRDCRSSKPKCAPAAHRTYVWSLRNCLGDKNCLNTKQSMRPPFFTSAPRREGAFVGSGFISQPGEVAACYSWMRRITARVCSKDRTPCVPRAV